MNRFDKNNAEIGERIKKIRLKRNMTQEMLSEKAGVCNPQQISNIERGLSGMSIAKFKDICRALDIDADYILFGVSTHNVETILNKYIRDMTKEQAANLLEIVKAYAKTCGIEEK
jgi:transcriptional regulator with XRE-family HTH domain